MSRTFENALPSFAQELEKLSAGGFLPSLARRALSAGSTAALGGAGGGALGGAVGAYRGARQAQEDGGSALRGGLGGAMQGAAFGATAGAALGGAGGALAGQAGANLAKSYAARKGTVGALSRFGQRQVHSLTGALPEGFANRSGAIRSIGAGGADVAERLKDVGEKLVGAAGKKRSSLLKKQQGLGRALQGATAAEEAGMTSIPGLFGAMMKPKQLASGVTGAAKQQWHGAGGVSGKATAAGVPLALVGGEAARGGEPGEGSRAERSLGMLGDSLPYAMLPMATGGAMALGALAGKGGRALGRRVGGKTKMPMPEDAEGLAAPPERVESPSVQGRFPEGMG